jgi:hypothetical protein
MTLPADSRSKENKLNNSKQYSNYLEEVTQGTTPKEIIDTFVEGLYDLSSWIEDFGGEFAENK